MYRSTRADAPVPGGDPPFDRLSAAPPAGGIHFCPHCYSPALRRSRARSVKERVLLAVGVAPYRCHRCFRRFHLPIPAMRLLGLEA